ncbi:MAG: MFS transporter [Rothia sp. (in: high G+C Gram-positive bacteria)]|nr:MFS transporter [Rothia sp. (in: high G+C Gram-positive bacteria)]
MSQTLTAHNSAVSRKAVVASSFGNAMEWYDFSVYAFFATYIAANFFEKGDSTQATIASFMVFGAGFIARPLGSLVLGILADRKGRKLGLLISLFTMATGIFIIAATPNVATIGLAAPVLLLIGRLLQGFSAGGELGSAASYLVEHAPAEKKAGYAAWLQGSMGISNLLAASAGLLVTTFFTDEAVEAWAWRLPFIFGLLLIPVGLYIRRQLPETEQFEREVHTRSTSEIIKQLVLNNWQALLAGVGFCVLWNVAVYSIIVFGPTYYKITEGLKFTSQQTFLASFVGNVFFTITCIFAGRLADKVGRQKVLTSAAVVLLVVPFFVLLLLHGVHSLAVLLFAHTILCICVALFVGVAPSTLPMAFTPETRSTGVSITYNLAAIGFAGFVPPILIWADTHISVFSPAFLISLCALVTLCCLPALFHQITRVENTDFHTLDQ